MRQVLWGRGCGAPKFGIKTKASQNSKSRNSLKKRRGLEKPPDFSTRAKSKEKPEFNSIISILLLQEEITLKTLLFSEIWGSGDRKPSQIPSLS